MTVELIELDDALATLAWITFQAESAMAITAGCATTSGDPEGAHQMTNSIASDIAINAQMLAEKIEALRARASLAGEEG